MFSKHTQVNTNVQEAVKTLKGVKYYLFDEQSLIGLSLLGILSERMKILYNSQDPLGGASVILLGGFLTYFHSFNNFFQD